ncbi:hypothetical protein ACN0IV_05960 [Trabulsiella odontotermitis]|uniref:hypothetical protein n=1 Tax=Trabulsiella odontotermitis TaxID=379893 RepID=UPI003AD27A11
MMALCTALKRTASLAFRAGDAVLLLMAELFTINVIIYHYQLSALFKLSTDNA